MNDQVRTNQELLDENAFLKLRIQELEKSEAERKRAEKIVRKKTGQAPEHIEAMQNEELRRELYFNLYDLAPIGYLTLSEQGLILEVNIKAATLLGLARGALLKQPLTRFIFPEDQDIYSRCHKLIFETGMLQACEIRMLRTNDAPFWTRIEAAVAQDVESDTPVCRAIISDITDRKQAEEALRESERRYRELSIVDDLTQLYNSRHFYNQLKMELDRVDRYEQPLTLLLLDLDDFKAFNDAYGHIEGDQVLSRFGQVVKRCLRQTDSAYRYGGEEFTILLPMTTGMDGAVTAERIRTEFKQELFSPAPGEEVHVTVSIGLAQYKPQEDSKAFIHRADQLMYQGKKNGKNRVCSEL
jgi:diguanylate cyclase (GGDEF)-like protein/PAS domain S-box-containing protein